MRIFSFLTRIFPIAKIFLLIKWLKTQRGWLYPIVGVKFFNYLIKYLIIAEKIKFMAIIRYIYYFLSAFNVVLGLIIFINFSDFASPDLLNFFHTTLELLIPVIILNAIDLIIEDLGLSFKNIFRKFIDWIYSKEEIIIDKKEEITAKIPTQDQFSFIASDLELDEFGFPKAELDEEQTNSWLTFALLTIAILGLSYSLHPELFHSIYSNLKDLFFPRGGEGSGDTYLPDHNTPSITAVQKATDRVIYDNNLTTVQKMSRITAMSKAILHEGHNYNAEEILDRMDLLDQAVRVIESNNTILDVSHITSSISTGDLTPTPTNISLPSNSSSSSSPSLTPTPTNISLPSNSPSTSAGSLTPTNNPISLPSQTPSNLNLQIPVASTTPDLISLDHSPILERIPNDLDWAKGGKLKGMFSNNSSSATTPIIENSTPIPIPAKTIDLDKMMDELNKK